MVERRLPIETFQVVRLRGVWWLQTVLLLWRSLPEVAKRRSGCPLLMEPTAHQRLKMAKTNLTKLGVDALLKLRDDIEAALLRRSGELRAQLARLGGDAARKGAKTHSLRGRKVATKYRDKSGNAWSGRGAPARLVSPPAARCAAGAYECRGARSLASATVARRTPGANRPDHLTNSPS